MTAAIDIGTAAIQRDFHRCDEAINKYFVAWREAAEAAIEISDRQLWRAGGYTSEKAYWESKIALAQEMGMATVSYEAVLGWKKAGRALKKLDFSGVPTDGFQSLRSARAVAEVPEEGQVEVAQMAVERADGDPVTGPEVQAAAAVHSQQSTLDEVQAYLDQFGATVGPFKSRSPKQKKFHYSVDFPSGRDALFPMGKVKLFVSLDDIRPWLEPIAARREAAKFNSFNPGDRVWHTRKLAEYIIASVDGEYCTFEGGEAPRAHHMDLDLVQRATPAPSDQSELTTVSYPLEPDQIDRRKLELAQGTRVQYDDTGLSYWVAEGNVGDPGGPVSLWNSQGFRDTLVRGSKITPIDQQSDGSPNPEALLQPAKSWLDQLVTVLGKTQVQQLLEEI